MIWYACYGSNMDLNRFLKYIRGGEMIVNGVTKKYDACPTDTEPPRQFEPYKIDRRFYFAKQSKTWNLHGVGFISTKRNIKSCTYAKLYLISKVQFSHLFAQENSKGRTNINFEHFKNKNVLDFNYNFYNRIIQLDINYKGFPILTFTNKEILQKNEPMNEYLSLICDGLKMTHNLNNNQILDYFKKRNTGAKRTNLKKLLKLE